mgnify:CR=1
AGEADQAEFREKVIAEEVIENGTTKD